MALNRIDPDDLESVAVSVDIINAAQQLDDPDGWPQTTEITALELRYGWDLEPEQRLLYCPQAGHAPVGVIGAVLPQRDNQHLVEVEFTVHPAHRRQGHGASMLAEFLEWVRIQGRSTVWMYPAAEDSPACGFLERRGFTMASQDVRRVQWPADTDWTRIDGLESTARSAAEDYRLERLSPPIPESVLTELVGVTAAINDAPMGDLDFADEIFDLARLRDFEAATQGKGERLYRVLARRISDGVIGAHTALVVQPRRPIYAAQYDTAVAREHRGHRLGLLLKIQMMRWLAEAEPQIEQIETWNNADNAFMITINEELGYRHSRTYAVYQWACG